jgi:hypothetical protein
MAKVKYFLCVILFLWLSSLVYLEIARSGCSFAEEYALQHVIDTVKRKNLDIQYLSEPKFDKESCSYDFIYKSPDKEISFVFTSWGNVNWYDYDND